MEENELPEEPEVPAANLTLAEKEDILAVYEDLEILLAEDFLEDLPQEVWATEICCSKLSDLSTSLTNAGKEVRTLLAADGYDLGTTKGFETIQHALAQDRTPWLICHVPKGPARQGLEDRMGTGSWRKFQKVVRHLLESQGFIFFVEARCFGVNLLNAHFGIYPSRGPSGGSSTVPEWQGYTVSRLDLSLK